MKSDKLKIYEGQLILPFGTPCIISTSWETSNHIHCESISILFSSDGKIDLRIFYHPIVKSNEFVNSIEDGINYGYQMAHRELRILIWNFSLRVSKKFDWISHYNGFEILLNEIVDSELIILSHIKKIDSSTLEFIDKNVKSDLLKSFVGLAKDLNIQVSQYPQNDITK